MGYRTLLLAQQLSSLGDLVFEFLSDLVSEFLSDLIEDQIEER